MKILHTADWHLGQLFYQNNREKEHCFFFEQLVQIIKDEHPDVLVISGDIFHISTPSSAVQKIYYQTLVEISHSDDNIQIIITAGNHDSPSRLEAPQELWNAFNVQVVGSPKRDSNGEYIYDDLVIPISKQGVIIGWILAVPFILPTNYPSISTDDSYSNRVAAFYKTLVKVAEKKGRKENEPLIAMGHLTMQGCDITGHDAHIVGGVEGVDIHTLPSCIDYWALGHIHHSQSVGKCENIRYAGSPFPMNFDEHYPHSVTLVDFNERRPNIKRINIKPLVDIATIPTHPLPFEEALISVMGIPEEAALYVRVPIYTETALTPTQMQTIYDAFNEKKAICCTIEPHFPQRTHCNEAIDIRSVSEMHQLSPLELACHVFEEKNNCNMPEEMKQLLMNICTNAQNHYHEN